MKNEKSTISNCVLGIQISELIWFSDFRFGFHRDHPSESNIVWYFFISDIGLCAVTNSTHCPVPRNDAECPKRDKNGVDLEGFHYSIMGINRSNIDKNAFI